jgi:hypothetical protein|tara:strand:- start:410 stop:571 length:162 start_codon:yes stop_codon:yes gene_type:complete
MDDTLKTTAMGLGSAGVVGLGVLPDVMSVAVGAVTFIWFCIRIWKELKKEGAV